MSKHFRIITKSNCTYCDQAKTLLTIRDHSYSEDRRETPEEIASFKSAGYRTFPQVFEGDRLIGGLDGLRAYLAGIPEDF